ncbi:hypothetical protein JCM10207_005649 [Rhodosporidiobolus poonsookiae]
MCASFPSSVGLHQNPTDLPLLPFSRTEDAHIVLQHESKRFVVRHPPSYEQAVDLAHSLFPSLKELRLRLCLKASATSEYNLNETLWREVPQMGELATLPVLVVEAVKADKVTPAASSDATSDRGASGETVDLALRSFLRDNGVQVLAAIIIVLAVCLFRQRTATPDATELPPLANFDLPAPSADVSGVSAFFLSDWAVTDFSPVSGSLAIEANGSSSLLWPPHDKAVQHSGVWYDLQARDQSSAKFFRPSVAGDPRSCTMRFADMYAYLRKNPLGLGMYELALLTTRFSLNQGNKDDRISFRFLHPRELESAHFYPATPDSTSLTRVWLVYEDASPNSPVGPCRIDWARQAGFANRDVEHPAQWWEIALHQFSLSHSIHLTPSPSLGYLQLALFCIAPSRVGPAWKAARAIVHGHAKGVVPATKGEVERAKSAAAWEVVSGAPSAEQAAHHLFRDLIRSHPPRFDQQLVERLSRVTPTQVQHALGSYFLPLFQPASAVLGMSTGPEGRAEVVSVLEGCGWAVEERAF